MPAPLRALLGHPHLTALRQSRWFKPATRALAALLGLWALSWLSVPALVKGPLERMASEQQLTNDLEQAKKLLKEKGVDFESGDHG